MKARFTVLLGKSGKAEKCTTRRVPKCRDVTCRVAGDLHRGGAEARSILPRLGVPAISADQRKSAV